MSNPEPRMKYIEGIGPTMAFEIPCHRCRRGFFVPMVSHVKGRKGKEETLNEARAARALAGAGWSVKRGLRHPTCPECQAKDLPENVIPIERASNARAAAEALFAPAPIPSTAPTCSEAEPQEEEEMKTKSLSAVPIAEPAPAPETARRSTIEQRRRIVDRLDTLYDQTAQRYRGDMSDAKLAAELSFPRAWIAEVRSVSFGEFDRNEASEKHDAALSAFEARIAEIEDRAMKSIETIGAEISKLRSELDTLRRKKG